MSKLSPCLILFSLTFLIAPVAVGVASPAPSAAAKAQAVDEQAPDEQSADEQAAAAKAPDALAAVQKIRDALRERLEQPLEWLDVDIIMEGSTFAGIASTGL